MINRRELIIGALSLAVSAGFIWYAAPWMDGDSHQYKALANNLLERGAYSSAPLDQPPVPDAIRAPGYPVFLAGCYRLMGAHDAPIVILQAIALAVVAIIGSWLGTQAFGSAVGWWTGLMLAIFPPLHFRAAWILSDSIALGLIMTGSWLMWSGARQRRWVRLWSGVVLSGLATYFRTAWLFAPWALAGALWLTSRSRHHIFGHLLGGALVASALFAPWLIRNQHLFGHPLAAMRQGPSMFYASWEGRMPMAEWQAAFRAAVSEQVTPDVLAPFSPQAQLFIHQYHDTAVAYHQLDALRAGHGYFTGDPKADVAFDQALGHIAKANISEDRWGFVARRITYSLPKLVMSSLPLKQDDAARLPAGWLRLAILPNAVVWVLALIGIWAWRARWREWLPAAVLVGYVVIVHLAQVCDPRYFDPAWPFLVLLAAAGIVAIRSWANRHVGVLSPAPSMEQVEKLA